MPTWYRALDVHVRRLAARKPAGTLEGNRKSLVDAAARASDAQACRAFAEGPRFTLYESDDGSVRAAVEPACPDPGYDGPPFPSAVLWPAGKEGLERPPASEVTA